MHRYFNRGIEIRQTKDKGLGVFASRIIPEGTVIEVAPVIIIPDKQDTHIQKTRLKHYVFEYFGDVAIGLGYASLFNHSGMPNVEYVPKKGRMIEFTALTDIEIGEELYIDYGYELED